jgi:hypothetical protein
MKKKWVFSIMGHPRPSHDMAKADVAIIDVARQQPRVLTS